MKKNIVVSYGRAKEMYFFYFRSDKINNEEELQSEIRNALINHLKTIKNFSKFNSFSCIQETLHKLVEKDCETFNVSAVNINKDDLNGIKLAEWSPEKSLKINKDETTFAVFYCHPLYEDEFEFVLFDNPSIDKNKFLEDCKMYYLKNKAVDEDSSNYLNLLSTAFNFLGYKKIDVLEFSISCQHRNLPTIWEKFIGEDLYNKFSLACINDADESPKEKPREINDSDDMPF
jgi:hypothetical protein